MKVIKMSKITEKLISEQVNEQVRKINNQIDAISSRLPSMGQSAADKAEDQIRVLQDKLAEINKNIKNKKVV